jgi:DNA-binding response OmpR family regulator
MDQDLCVLYIGLNSELANAISVRLKPCGYQFRSANSAREALGCLRDYAFDLALLNLQLPDAHGLCLLSMMSRLYPVLPVLALSEDESTEVMVKALRLGAKGYLTAPFDLGQVLFCIDEIIKLEARIPQNRSRPRVGRIRPQRISRGILNDVEEEM